MASYMAKRKYTLTLDEQIVLEARSKCSNLSSTVSELLRSFIQEQERASIMASLKIYEEDSQERRAKLGLFSDDKRKFM